VAPSAKTLILELLDAACGAPLPVRAAVVAGSLFDIHENSVRVALVRLAAAGLIESAGRGAYSLAEGARDLAREVASWRDAEQRVRAWQGDYVFVHTGALGRADKRALRQRTRALSLLGLAEAERGLYVRPDNLEGGVERVRERLGALGLEAQAPVFRGGGFSAELEQRVHALWDGKRLSASYTQGRRKLEHWLSRAPRLPPDAAARESFLLGSQAIRQIVFDPLLPPPLVEVEERRSFIAAMRELDREGRHIWRRFFQASQVAELSAIFPN
jgi:phenylacetic acid degradation operon negative regulatory protein